MNDIDINKLISRLERQAYLLGCTMGALASAYNDPGCPMSIKSELEIQIRGLGTEIDKSYFPERVNRDE